MNLINSFKALSDKNRLRLVNILLHFELNVNEIVSVLRISQPRVSRHLKILLECGLVSSRRDGLWIFYSLSAEENVGAFINSIKAFFTENELKTDIIRCKKIIENRAKATTGFFNKVAGDWSKLKQNLIGDFDINNIISRYMNKCELAVDLGCGNGDLIPVLLEHSERVIGVDRSQKMLGQAARHLFSDAERVNLRLGDLEHLPLSNNEADFAVANMVLHHLSSPLAAIQDIFRILKRNGSFLIIDLLKHDNEIMRTKHNDRWLGFESEEIKKWLIRTGFDILDSAVFDIKNGLQLILFSVSKK